MISLKFDHNMPFQWKYVFLNVSLRGSVAVQMFSILENSEFDPRRRGSAFFLASKNLQHMGAWVHLQLTFFCQDQIVPPFYLTLVICIIWPHCCNVIISYCGSEETISQNHSQGRRGCSSIT